MIKMKNLLKELSPESRKQYTNAVVNGANEAHFCFAGGSQFYRYDITDINRGMNAHRTQKLSLRYVKVNALDSNKWDEIGIDRFWNNFVDDREMIYYR